MERGVTILVSNGAYQEISDLYKFAYRICLKKTKSIGNTAKHHKVHEEFLFICDPFSRKKMWSNLGHIENKRILK